MMESPEIRKVMALVRRDMTTWTTYKSQVVTTLVGGAIGVAAWGLNANFRNVPVPEYNTDYVSFLVVGVLISNLILAIGTGLQNKLNPWTLETILMTGPTTGTLVLGTSLWPYVLSVIFVVPQLWIGVYYFHAVLIVNYLSFAIAGVISGVIVFSLAIIGTGIRIVTKVTDPFTWALGVAAQILSGMTFPVQYLNTYVPGLSTVSWILPQTWIYDIIRLSTLEGASVTDPSTGFAFLVSLGIALVLLPISLYVFSWGLRRAKKEGTLGYF